MTALSKYPPGSIRELVSLAFPLFLSLISSSLMTVCDRLFIAHYSLDAFKAVGIAGYLAFFFQLPMIRLTGMNQSLIARSLGEKNLGKIGSYTWQTIWCSLLFMLALLPISYFSGTIYFAHSEVEQLCKDYYSILLIVNCIFPIGVSLAAFQTGTGGTKTLAIVTLFSNLLNALLDFLLINGVPPLISPLGIKGAAIATLISQGTYCGILYFLFLNHTEKERYQTCAWELKKNLFKESLKMGIPRATSAFVIFSFWLLAINFAAKRGGDYLILISFGSTIYSVTSSISESINRSLVTTLSYFLGEGNWGYVWKSLKSGILLFFILFGFLSIPFVLLNQELIKEIIGLNLSSTSLHTVTLGCYWIWIFFFLEGVSYSSFALLTALKESFFIAKTGIILNFLLMFLPFLFAFHYNSLGADKIWMIIWFCSIGCLLINTAKIRSLYKTTLLHPKAHTLKNYFA
jgi:MATE family multidrug resistance protein